MFQNYSLKLNKALSEIDESILDKIYIIFKEKIQNKGFNIFCGNGGSYANSSHIVGDYQKTFSHYDSIFASIGDNFCALSAISNDVLYEDAIITLIRPYLNNDSPSNIFFLSGSGNSINLVKAAELIKEDYRGKDVNSISITAYGGGRLSQICDYSIKSEIKDMEIAEDLQMIIFHYFKQKLMLDLKKPILKNIKYKKRTNESIIT